MKRSWLISVGVVLCVLVTALRRGEGANPPASRAAADPADERLTFLTLQLSSTEESIKALNTAIKAAGYKARVAEDRASTAERGNELMDRKGGAPVAWDKFYGRTAGHFIVRIPPVNKLNINVKGGGPGPTTYPTNDPVRRPAQFDYLYRANSDQAAKAREQVEAMDKRIESLLGRRRQLEAEQVKLWATIALETIGNRELATRPLYRFRLNPAGGGTGKAVADARAEVVRAAAVFLRTTDRAAAGAADIVGTDPSGALASLKATLAPAEDALRGAELAHEGAAAAAPAQGQQLKDLLALAKRAQLLCKNMVDAERLALDGEAAGDEPRKQMFRGQLQESLLGLADATVEFDDAATALAAAWDVRPEAGVDAQYALPNVAARTGVASKESSSTPPAGETSPLSPAAGGAAITLSASTKVNILPLERGAPRLYDSNPMRRIEGFDGSLNGWQFVSIPQRVVITYAVHVNKPCTLYAFGKAGDMDQIFGRERAKWELAGGAISGKNVGFALRRRVAAGEELKFGGFEIQLAAESIEIKGAGGR